MNEELQNKLVEYLDRIEHGAKVGGDFIASEAPLFVNELLVWTFWGHVFVAVFAAVTISAMLAVIVAIARKSSRCETGNGEEVCFLSAFILGILLLAIPTPAFFVHTYRAVKTKVAPRVVIVEELSKLSKQVTGD